MSNQDKKSPYEDIPMDVYAQRMKENREKYDSKDGKGDKESKIWKVIKGIFVWRINVVAAFLGIDKDDLSSSKSSGVRGRSHNHSSSAGFRQQYHHEPPPFNPEQEGVRRAAYDAYYDMVDGKGDHDCDHEH